MIGRSLAHYKILELLGAGGMGQVYRALDTKLQRQVALKILPGKSADELARRLRFEREAQALAALDHPNIVTVYSIEEASSREGETFHFLTMQLVRGQPLDQAIPAGGMPLSDFFEIAIPLAEALAAAHEQRIVHRDLKPSNIIVSADGRPHILDFGLAKLLQKSVFQRTPIAPGPVGELTALTEEGAILGTVDYMSPEQLEGKEADHRSDVFSLGVILHQMATGARPFSGANRASVIASIVKDTPAPITQLRPSLPRQLARIVEHALAKNPERRFQSAKDLHTELADLRLEIISEESAGRPPGERSSTAKWTWLLGLAAGLALALAAWLYFALQSPVVSPVQARPITSLAGSELDPAVSPDGRQVAFVWDGESKHSFDLYVKLIDAGEPLALTRGAVDVRCPAWAPNGREIAFLRSSGGMNYEIMAVPALSGTPRSLGEVSNAHFAGLDWSPDNRLLATVHRSAAGAGESIYLFDVESGRRWALSQPPTSGIGDKLPVFSPDGRRLAFVRWYEARRSDIHVISIDGTGDRCLLIHDGHIRGLDWLPDGSGLVFSSKMPTGSSGLWQVTLEGKVKQLLFGEDAESVALSPDGRLVYSRRLIRSNIWRVSGPAAGRPSPPGLLIESTRDDWSPRYSPDGAWIAISSERTGQPQVWICNSDGSGCRQRATSGVTAAPHWSPDSKRLAVVTETEGDADVQLLQLEGGFLQRLTEGPSADAPGDWSPDGQLIYFFSDRSGEFQVWKLPADGGSATQVTRNGGVLPQVTDDGESLYYMKLTNPLSIWRMPLPEGSETLILESEGLGRSGFDLWRNQLVFVQMDSEQGPSIESLDLDTGRVRRLASLGRQTRLGRYGRISVSPDGQWIAYPQEDGPGADLILVENFRQND